MIIGKQGANVKRLQQQFGVTVDVPGNVQGIAIVTIIGQVFFQKEKKKEKRNKEQEQEKKKEKAEAI